MGLIVVGVLSLPDRDDVQVLSVCFARMRRGPPMPRPVIGKFGRQQRATELIERIPRPHCWCVHGW
jgi:hypothetical protein